MASTLNDNNAANNSILETNDISELNGSKMGANTVLGYRMFNLQAKMMNCMYLMTLPNMRQVNTVGGISNKIATTIVQRDIIRVAVLVLPL